METLFEFMFGASGRINRARYWQSLLVFCVAGLFVAVILMTAVGIAAPLFIVALVVVLLPWILWGFSIHTERLHDRDKSAWWLLVFYGSPAVLGNLADEQWIMSTGGYWLSTLLGFAGFVLTIWGFIEIGCLPGTRGPNRYGNDPLLRTKGSRQAA